VDKADALELIKKDMARTPETGSACIAILEFIAKQDLQFVKRLTFGQLMRVAGLSDPADVLPAVQYLTGARLHLLDPRFEFIDVTTDYIEEVDLDVVAQARADSVFYHPHSGEPVADFESALFMFFVPGRDALDLGGKSDD
jgi:hypothetical protein